MAQVAKSSLLVTRYSDGAARWLGFLDAHQLVLGYSMQNYSDAVQQGPDEVVPLMIDFEESRVRAIPKPEQLNSSFVGTLSWSAYAEGLVAETNGSVIEVRRKGAVKGRLVRRLERAGKRPMLCFGAEGSLFSSSTEVLNRWNLETGRAQKFKCHDRVTHVAGIGRLLAAQNKEGVISLFDAVQRTRLVCVRPTMGGGWIAFDDEGAWDSSVGFTRGVELSWSDAKSTAFVPGKGFGWLDYNQFPLTRLIPATGGKCRGLIALRTAGFW